MAHIKTAPKKGKTLEDFRREFDPAVKIPNALKAGIASMLAEGRETWEYEMDFLKRCPGVSNANIGPYKGQFAKHIVIVKVKQNERTVWFADASVAARARG